MNFSCTAVLALVALLSGEAVAAPVPKYATGADITSHHDRLHRDQPSSGEPSNTPDVPVNPVGARGFDIILYQRITDEQCRQKHNATASATETTVKTWEAVQKTKPAHSAEAAVMVEVHKPWVGLHHGQADYHAMMHRHGFDPALSHAEQTTEQSYAGAVRSKKAAEASTQIAQNRLGKTWNGKHRVDENGKRIR